ncbi:MAG TPA: serine hydrolase domain-containing protein [Gemmatimonadaceae bacterium]|nr:serine hydrolase domain-containing protein [Gemmatimonadaceae bacterium]
MTRRIISVVWTAILLSNVVTTFACQAQGASRVPDAEIIAQLKAHVDRLAQADSFSGAVLIAKDGKVLWSQAYGIADRNFNVPNKVDTKFNLGSMNKMFTAVAIAQLVERGVLSFDDPVSKWVPGALQGDAGDKVRIKHLLSHTSGLGSYFTDEWDKASRALYRSVDDWMPLAKQETLQFEPGTRWAYSNTGMLVAGKVIEAASKQSYFDYVREHIYKPAGMANTDAYELDMVTPNLAVGYEREMTSNGPRWRNNIFMHVIKGGPAGGGYSTVEDLLKFDVALRSGKLVGEDFVRLLTTPKPEISSPQYGYGFGIFAGGQIVGHSGGFPGISANLDMYLTSGYTTAVLSNYGRGSQPVVQKARALLSQ